MRDWLSEAATISRTELRELNDLTLSRLEARLEQRVKLCETRLEERLAVLEAETRAAIAKAETDFLEWLLFVICVGQACFAVTLVLTAIAGR